MAEGGLMHDEAMRDGFQSREKDAKLCPKTACTWPQLMDEEGSAAYSGATGRFSPRGDAGELLARVVAMAHDDPVHLLVLLLSVPTGLVVLTNEEIAARVGDVGKTASGMLGPKAVAKRRKALALEFPLLASLLTPGSGRRT